VTGGTADIVIRPIEPHEHEALGALTVAAYRDFVEVADDLEYIHELRDVTARARQVPVLVALDRAMGEVLGGVAYIPGPGPFAEMERDDEAGIRMLAVAPEAQGRGVGRALTEACIERARAAGKRRVVLLTAPTMTVAHALYRSLGFERDSSLDWEYSPGRHLMGFALELHEGSSAGSG
jgi:ribosomal protein S18 acetylase RimI-like enzyme